MIIVSGASGFIGQHLLHQIDGAMAVSLREQNWTRHLCNAEVLVNLVGKAHDHNGKATEADYYYTNVTLTQEVFKAFLKSSAMLMIHVSSIAAVEEFESSKPLTEMDCCNPLSCYGKSKRIAEEWLLQQTIPIDRKLVILRPPMVHGEGDKGNLGLLYKLISRGIPYPLSSFNNQRSFISLQNFSFLIKEIIKKKEVFRSGIYHVADDEPISTKDIIYIIKNITKRNILDVKIPRFLIQGLAKLGDYLPIPLNSKRLKKMTGNLLVSNLKIKQELNIQSLPMSAHDGMEMTISSFQNSQY